MERVHPARCQFDRRLARRFAIHSDSESASDRPRGLGNAVRSERNAGPYELAYSDHRRRFRQRYLAPVGIAAWHEPESRSNNTWHVLAIAQEWAGTCFC